MQNELTRVQRARKILVSGLFQKSFIKDTEDSQRGQVNHDKSLGNSGIMCSLQMRPEAKRPHVHILATAGVCWYNSPNFDILSWCELSRVKKSTQNLRRCLVVAAYILCPWFLKRVMMHEGCYTHGPKSVRLEAKRRLTSLFPSQQNLRHSKTLAIFSSCSCQNDMQFKHGRSNVFILAHHCHAVLQLSGTAIDDQIKQDVNNTQEVIIINRTTKQGSDTQEKWVHYKGVWTTHNFRWKLFKLSASVRNFQ